MTGPELRKIQEADPEIGPVLKWKVAGCERPDWKEIRCPGRTTLILWQQWGVLRVREGALYRVKEVDPARKTRIQMIIPQIGKLFGQGVPGFSCLSAGNWARSAAHSVTR